MPPPPGSDKHETKKSQSNKIVPSDDGESEQSEEEYQAVTSPSSPQGLLKMRSALDDLTNASQSPSDQTKKEANKEVVKDISKKINRNTPALELAKNNEINIKYELEPSSAAVTTIIINFVEKPLTVDISTISKAATTEEESLLKKPLVLQEKPTTRDTTHIKRSLSLKKDINWNKTSGFVEPLSLLEETESDLEFVSEPVTFGNKHEIQEATFSKRTLPSSELYISQGKQFYCVKELISHDNNTEKDSFMETMNFRKKPKTEESTTTERLLTLNKCTAQEKGSYKRKPLILQKATSREELLNKEPFPFENKSTTKDLRCVKEMTSLDDNIEKDSIMEPLNFRKKPKADESTTTERLLTLNKCTAQEKGSCKRKPLILQKATSREELLNKEPFPFENKSTTKDLRCVKEMTSLDNNIEKDSIMEPLNFRKKPKADESTTTERLLTLNKCTAQEKGSCKRKPLILQKATSREELLNKEPFPFENKSTTKDLRCVKEMTSLDNNIEKDSIMEPLNFRKKPKADESTTTERLLTLNKCTAQEKGSCKRKPLILQKATSREELLNKEPFPFENKSTTKDLRCVKEMTSLDNNIEKDSIMEPLNFRKKPKADESTTTERLLTLNKCTAQEKGSYKRKPLILQKATSREELLNKEPFPFENKSTTKDLRCVKEMTSLDNNIEKDSIMEPLNFRKKPKADESTTTERLLTLNKCTAQEKGSYKRKPLILQKATSREELLNKEPFPFENKSTTKDLRCVKEMTSLDNNIEKDSIMEPLNFRKKPKADESTTTERLLTLNKCTAQEKGSCKRKPLILQKATSREELLNKEPFPFENKSTTKDLRCVKEMTSLDNNIEKDSIMEPLNFRKKPKADESTTTERLLTLNKCTAQEKGSYKRKPLILQKATSRKELLSKEPFPFENKSTTKDLRCVKEMTSLDNNIEKDSIMEPLNFRKKPKADESTTTERLLTLNKCTAQEKGSYKRKPLILQKATSREELLNKEPFPFENKSTTKDLRCVKEMTSLDNNIEKDSIMEPLNFRKKPKADESTTTERLLTLNKCTAQEKGSYKRKPLILQKATSREELLNKETFPFENKSTTKEFLFQEPFQEKHTTEGDMSVVKKPLALQKTPTEEVSLLKEPLVTPFKKKHTIEEATPKMVLVIVKRHTIQDRLSSLKKPLVLPTISEEKSLIKEPLSFKKKPTTEEEFLFKESCVLPEKHTTQGEVALLKKPWALQENIHSKDEFLMEPVSFRKKHTTNEAISNKEPLSLKKKKYATQIMMSICQEVLDLQNMIGKDKDFFVMKPGAFRKKSSTEEAIDTKTPLSLKKKHIIDTKEDSLKKLLTLQEKSTTEEDSLFKKPLILKRKLSTKAIISTDSQLSLKKKYTAQGEVFLLKKQLSLQQKPSIEKESPIIEELTFQRKLAINDSFNLKTLSLNEKSTTGKKSFKEPLALQDNPTQKEDTFLKDVSILPVNTSSHLFNSPPESRKDMSLSDIMSIVRKYKNTRKYSARKPSSKKPVSYWRHVSRKEITLLEIIDKTHYDPFFNLAYTKDIFKYMKEREEKFRLKNYMSSQTDINSDMRAVLVNSLVKIQINCDLNHETLYLAVKLVDHYLMKKICKKENLQLLGATAFLIAAKLEETYPPKLDKFLKSRNEAYQRHEMLAMEISILRTLEFEVNIPVAYHFLRMYSMNIHVDIKTMVLSRFICELTLQEYDFIQEKASELAAASFLLALYMTKLGQEVHFLDYHFDYMPSDLSRLIKKLNTLLTLYPCNDRYKAVRFKYSHQKFHEVTKIPPLDKLKLEEILNSRYF